jgi:hypothetical protein
MWLCSSEHGKFSRVLMNAATSSHHHRNSHHLDFRTRRRSGGRRFLEQGLEAIGKVQSISAREFGRIIARGATNVSVVFGVALQAAFFGASRGSASNEKESRWRFLPKAATVTANPSQ